MATAEHCGFALTTTLVRGVIFQLFGLGPLTVLPAISGVLALIAVGQHHIVADHVVLNVRHGARSGAFTLRSGPETPSPCAPRVMIYPSGFWGLCPDWVE